MPRLCSSSITTILFTLALGVAPAHAEPFALAKATLDWTGFSFHISEGLSVDSIVVAYIDSQSGVDSTYGGSQFNAGDSSSSAISSYVNTNGGATSSGTVNNGLLESSSEAATLGDLPGFDAASSDVSASTAFWLYGSGRGSLTVEVPYTLIIETLADATEVATAEASVFLNLGPGAGWYASDSLSWTLGGGSLTKSGTLALTRDFEEPTWGPLVFIGAGASTNAVTRVPEPSALVLLGWGAVPLALALFRMRQHTKPRRLEQQGPLR